MWFRVPDLGFGYQGLKFRVSGSGFRVYIFRVSGFGFSVQELRSMVQSLSFRGLGPEFRMKSRRCRVQSLGCGI